uniref:Homeobox domain-containing protein n=1 Tax=Chelydra serpentina TaxID=8475 RepID=A0A8C3XX43_CHESE
MNSSSGRRGGFFNPRARSAGNPRQASAESPSFPGSLAPGINVSCHPSCATFLSPSLELSPASSSSGTRMRYTPDSATSPNTEPPSPHPAIRMGGVESGGGVKKAKSRTAFSQEQLQTLHQRFQSQKYLSPQQIRELGSALGLTYKQVKTWFQNQRMKFKRCQKETQWMEKGTCLSQVRRGFIMGSYLDLNPSYHQGCPVSASRNIQTVTNVHQSYGSSQTYGSGQSLYPFVAIEEEGFFGKAGGACSAQQAMGFFSQQKMNFYHGFPANMDYASMETEDGYHFQNASVSATSFPGTAGCQQYQPAWHPQGTQSNYNS